MSTPDFSLAPRSPRFTKAAWVILVGGIGLTWVVYQWCELHRRPGDWFPGLPQAIIGAIITAVGSSGCGLAALLRRERRSWLALPPLLLGLVTLLYFAGNLIRHSDSF
jgi:hypothetical protein